MRQDVKVRLRDLRLADLEKIWQWRNDPEVTEFLSNLKISRLQIEVWFKEYDSSPRGRFFAVETEEARFIGYTGLRDINWTERTCMMDIIIGDKSYWSQGFGQSAVRALLDFAFDEIEMSKVGLAVLPFNTRGIRCYERCGFRRAGFFREKSLRRSKLWQPIHMEVTRTQYDLACKVSPS